VANPTTQWNRKAKRNFTVSVKTLKGRKENATLKGMTAVRDSVR
jgi:hypothetical protein